MTTFNIAPATYNVGQTVKGPWQLPSWSSAQAIIDCTPWTNNGAMSCEIDISQDGVNWISADSISEVGPAPFPSRHGPILILGEAITFDPPLINYHVRLLLNVSVANISLGAITVDIA